MSRSDRDRSGRKLLAVSSIDFVFRIFFVLRSRIRESKRAFLIRDLFDWILQGLLVPCRSIRFYSVCAFSGGGWCEGVLLYGGRKSRGSSVPRGFSASDACFAHDEPSSMRVGGVGLGKAAKATYVRGVALGRELSKVKQA